MIVLDPSWTPTNTPAGPVEEGVLDLGLRN